MPYKKSHERISLIKQHVANSNQSTTLMLACMYQQHANQTITTVAGLKEMRLATEISLRAQKYLSPESVA